MLQPVAHRDALAATEQEIVDGFLDLEDVDVDAEVGIAAADTLDRARHHHLRDARYRADAQLRQSAAADLGDELGEVVHLLVDAVDLLEDVLGFRRREIAAVLALEEADAERAFGIFDEAADPRGRNVEQLRRAADGARHHHGTDHFNLAQRHHVLGIRKIIVVAIISREPRGHPAANVRQRELAARARAAATAFSSTVLRATRCRVVPGARFAAPRARTR
ncbi:hypothetical protein ACVW1A_003335 [Bradyrhizobium sp. LB1.3]